MRRFANFPISCVGRSIAIGSAVSADEITKAANVTGASNALRPTDAAWVSIDILGRQRLGQLASTVTAAPLYDIRAEVAAKPPAAPISDVKGKFAKNDFKTIADLVRFYEEVIYPVRQLDAQAQDLQIEVYGLKDHIKLGLNLFSQDVLDEKKKLLVETEAKLAKTREQIAAEMEKNFTTGIYNDLVNALRLAGGKQEHARDLGMRLLDDMTQFGVPLDGDSQMLLKNLTFGDGPQEDSNLLFTYCEFPERGEVSVSNDSLEMIADSALKTIADRHQTPLTGDKDTFGTKLRLGETHPLLQRSSD